MTDRPTQQKCDDTHAIEKMVGFRNDQVASLKSHWISTMEAFVACAASSTGKLGLCKLLDIDSGKLERLLVGAREVLGDEQYERLLTPTPGGPLGALIEDDSKIEGKPEDPEGENS